MNSAINLVLKLWAYVPFFSLTDDLGFLSPNPGSEEHEFYFSMINILLGEIKIQIGSFPVMQPHKKWKLFRLTKLSEMPAFFLSDDKISQLRCNFDNHYSLLTDEDKKIERESLLNHLSEQKERIDASYTKINAYTSIILAIIPVVVTLADKETLLSLTLLGKLIFVLLIYANINVCAWIFQVNRVRGYSSSSYADLKNSVNKEKEFMWQIYYDWQETKKKADMFVSYSMYTQVAIIGVIILTVFLFAVIPIKNQTPKTDEPEIIMIYGIPIEC